MDHDTAYQSIWSGPRWWIFEEVAMRALQVPVLILFSLTPALSAEESVDDARIWLRNELRNLQQIRSIEFVVVREQEFGSVTIPPDAPVDRPKLEHMPNQMEMKFVANGMCLRAEVGDTNIITFDGTTLRTLRDHGRAFGESKFLPDAPLTAFPHPIVWAYRWARPIKSYGDIPSIQDDANWVELIESARVTENGTIEVSRVDSSGEGYLYAIERSAEGRLSAWEGYKLPQRKSEGRVTVVSSMDFTDEADEMIWLPTEIRFDANGEGTVRIDPATLKINHEIDPDVFTISRFEAQELLPVSDPAFMPDSDVATRSFIPGNWQAIIMLNVLVVACLVAYWRWRQR